jgi:DNA-binding Lrp family transcriptional regulator
VDKEYVNIDNSQRRQAVVDYISNFPECHIEEVVKHCDKIGMASRVTVRKIIDELVKEGLVKKERSKSNSKSVKLDVDPQNLLVIIPQNLERIFSEFSLFMDELSKIPYSEDNIRFRMTNSLLKKTIDNVSDHHNLSDALVSIPFIILDVINDVITFSLLFELPKKTPSSTHVSKLYSKYFESLNKMYLQASLKLSDAKVTLHDTSSEYFRYAAYLESKEQSGFRKACYLVYLCYRYDIAKEMYRVLDLLWIKNIESVSLMYNRWYLEGLFLDYDRDRQSKFDIHYVSKLEELRKNNNHLAYNNEMLNKIHKAINLYIVLERFLPNEGKVHLSGSGY